MKGTVRDFETGAPVNATVTISMDIEPMGAAQVTVAEATVTDDPPAPLPTNVSFANDVFPMFTNRGCVGCHSGNGAGRGGARPTRTRR